MEQPNWPDRILLLLRQGRAVQAEQELHRVLHDDPNDAHAHALMALALLEQTRAEEALTHAQTSVGLSPEHDFAYYLLSLTHQRLQHPAEAREAIEQALSLDPTDPNYHHTLGILRFTQGQWAAALRAAEMGLAYDPEHVDCLGLRARCLARLGRSDDAASSLSQALHYDPDDAGTHADAGWVALETGKHKEALEHFRNALRLAPTSEYARSGLVEALKARYWLYRAFLRFTVWSENLNGVTRRVLFVGLYILVRFVPLLLPLYLPLVFMSWFADPLFNGLLLLNPYGRHALSPEQRRQALGFGVVLVAATAAFTVSALAHQAWLGAIGLGLLAAIFPLMVTLRPRAPKRTQRWAMAATVALVLLGLLGGGLQLVAPDSQAHTGVMGLLFIIWLLFIWTMALS
ncbi:tetratricopeptide repeat protein [Hymenobacter taeanensis]|uniref:Tetratricopeptide repeat protein n=1 Tax=Hymenobacter taeanensis TaxID=2735321 RepID=A0A6M6BGT6_9BACT|nr:MULTISPECIES: tetratricopeptide repeat protein [Hymenobacter]QJX47447.1 tetratricopeptide repeat protein [Hymenobacter taeanensis]UOQ83071.1 tetratricopeptide repeat protein [Hymenobacter sp. 5414T-23]